MEFRNKSKELNFSLKFFNNISFEKIIKKNPFHVKNPNPLTSVIFTWLAHDLCDDLTSNQSYYIYFRILNLCNHTGVTTTLCKWMIALMPSYQTRNYGRQWNSSRGNSSILDWGSFIWYVSEVFRRTNTFYQH